MFVQDSHSLNFLNIFFVTLWFDLLCLCFCHLKVKDGLSIYHSINLFFFHILHPVPVFIYSLLAIYNNCTIQAKTTIWILVYLKKLHLSFSQFTDTQPNIVSSGLWHKPKDFRSGIFKVKISLFSWKKNGLGWAINNAVYSL